MHKAFAGMIKLVAMLDFAVILIGIKQFDINLEICWECNEDAATHSIVCFHGSGNGD